MPAYHVKVSKLVQHTVDIAVVAADEEQAEDIAVHHAMQQPPDSWHCKDDGSEVIDVFALTIERRDL